MNIICSTLIFILLVPPAPDVPTCKRENFTSFDNFVECNLKLAEKNIQPEQTKVPTKFTMKSETNEALGSNRSTFVNDPQYNNWWLDRDRRLVRQTAVFGVIWGASTILSIVFASIVIHKGNQTIDSCTMSYNRNCQESSQNTVKSAQDLYIPTIVASSIAGGSTIGFIVSGIVLGVHRSRPPKAYMSMTSNGFKIKF